MRPQLERQKGILEFYLKNCNGSKSICVNHFKEEKISPRTIYKIISNYEERGTVKRKTGSGRKRVIMNPQNLRHIKKLFKHKSGISQNQASRLLDCTRQYISKTLKRKGIRRYKKKKASFYKSDEVIQKLKKDCGWLYKKSV